MPARGACSSSWPGSAPPPWRSPRRCGGAETVAQPRLVSPARAMASLRRGHERAGGMADAIRVETRGNWRRITLNRPERMNALDTEAVVALTTALQEAGQ